MIRSIHLALAGAALAVAAPCQDGDGTIVQVAQKAGKFGTLLTAAKAAGLADALGGKGPFTVFAPTDAAFAKLGKDKLADLLKPENKGQLAKILQFHVVAGNVPAKDAVKLDCAATIGGQVLPLELAGETLMVGGARVVATDIAADNGVIHVIDTVMIPGPNLVEVAQKAGKFGTLIAAAKAAGLAGALADEGPFTVFAPTDEAFAKLGQDTIQDLLKPENKSKLAAILKHHVVAGNVMAKAAVKLDEAKTIGGTTLDLVVEDEVLTVGGAKVIKADVTASNGVIHVIDAVLLPND